MRTTYSIKNSITALVGNGISYFIAFIAQAIFIRLLGVEYLGLNGLFSNILTMFTIFELGIGNAIVYNLYKPIKENDKNKVNALMNFYKKAYNIIAFIILVVGLIMLPLIPYIVDSTTIDVNIYAIYILFLSNTIVSYLMVYKRNIIIAHQKNYIVNIIHVIYIIILNVVQLLIIYFTKNYYLYLGIKIICQLLENLIINIVANKNYYDVLNNKKITLDKETEKDIFSRVSALFFHKIGSIIVLSTDNIIISKFLGLITVGLYTNYNTITSAVSSLFGQIISSTTASVGNLLVSSDCQKRFDVFKKMRFLNFYISTFTSVCILCITQSFIIIWLGKDYLLNIVTLFIIVLNFFQKMQRNVYSTFKDSAGIWKEDRFVPIVESILNVIFSIILLKLLGLPGVFLGTILSGLSLWCFSYPKFVYSKLFERSYIEYAKETLGYIFIFLFIAIISYLTSCLFVYNDIWLNFGCNVIISVLIPNILLFLIFFKTDNYKYFVDMLNKMINKIKHK